MFGLRPGSQLFEQHPEALERREGEAVHHLRALDGQPRELTDPATGDEVRILGDVGRELVSDSAHVGWCPLAPQQATHRA